VPLVPPSMVLAVRGSDAADRAYAVLDAGTTQVLQPPRLAAAGWWLIDAGMEDLSPALIRTLSSESALMVVGGAADAAVVSVFEPGVPVVDATVSDPGLPGMPPPAESSPGLCSWLERVPPKRLSAKAQQTLWAKLEGSNGYEVAEALFRRMGFAYRGREPQSLLDGFVFVIQTLPHYVGDTNLSEITERWVAGGGTDFFGLWDLDRPGPPVQRWPKTPDSAQAIRALMFERVAAPIQRRTVLPGRRRWVGFSGQPEMPAFFSHFAPGGRLAIVLASDPPITWRLSGPGRIGAVSRAIARDSTLREYELGGSMLQIPNEDVADRIAQALVSGIAAAGEGRVVHLPWANVPDSVPRGYLETAAWVRDQVL
jgi:hypothetical protein